MEWLNVDRKDIKRRVLKRNPLKHIEVMQRLNPYAVAQKNIAKAVEASRKKLKQERLDAKRGVSFVDVTSLYYCIYVPDVCTGWAGQGPDWTKLHLEINLVK